MRFLKNNLKLIIGFIVGVILASSITVYATSYFANQVTYKDGKNVEQALNELYNRNLNAVSYISIDKAYLESGYYPQSVQITENNFNSSDGLSITGTGADKKWEKEIDLTNYTILSFYAKKGANHGRINVVIDNDNLIFKSYSDIDGNWKRYLIDISEYTGNHYLKIYGGWGDNTGNSYSNTQYCDIKLFSCNIN